MAEAEVVAEVGVVADPNGDIDEYHMSQQQVIQPQKKQCRPKV